MADRKEEPRFKWQDGLGIFGVLLAVAAMTDMPIHFRLACFAACAICLPISFSSHKNWPLWVRWPLSIVVVALMFYVGYNAWSSSRPKVDVFIEWRQPAPMEFGSSLSNLQLNAKAKANGIEVPGTYLYNPTFGAELQSGMDTLSVEFTPTDLSRFNPAKQTLVVLVKDKPLDRGRIEPPSGKSKTPAPRAPIPKTSTPSPSMDDPATVIALIRATCHGGIIWMEGGEIIGSGKDGKGGAFEGKDMCFFQHGTIMRDDGQILHNVTPEEEKELLNLKQPK